MTEQHRAELRQLIVSALAVAGFDAGDIRMAALLFRSRWARSSEGDPPPLTTAQQLALSVLLGDDIPLGVLLSACEDAGVFADGLAGEIAEKARAEEREQGAIAAMMFTLTRADELRAGLHDPLYSTEAATLDDHAAWLRDRMMERA